MKTNTGLTHACPITLPVQCFLVLFYKLPSLFFRFDEQDGHTRPVLAVTHRLLCQICKSFFIWVRRSGVQSQGVVLGKKTV